MSAFSDYTKPFIWDMILNGNAPGAGVFDGDIFIALLTSEDPSDEISGNGYARASVDSSSSDKWTVSGGLAYNTASITFPIASGGNWGTITHIAVYDALTGGNLVLDDTEMIESVTINNGDTFRFLAAQIKFTLPEL